MEQAPNKEKGFGNLLNVTTKKTGIFAKSSHKRGLKYLHHLLCFGRRNVPIELKVKVISTRKTEVIQFHWEHYTMRPISRCYEASKP